MLPLDGDNRYRLSLPMQKTEGKGKELPRKLIPAGPPERAAAVTYYFLIIGLHKHYKALIDPPSLHHLSWGKGGGGIINMQNKRALTQVAAIRCKAKPGGAGRAWQCPYPGGCSSV